MRVDSTVLPASIHRCKTFGTTRQRADVALPERYEAVVTAWDPEEGVGSLAVEAGPDVWAHYSVIEMSGYRALSVGQRVEVEYERVADQDGFARRATRIWPMHADSD